MTIRLGGPLLVLVLLVAAAAPAAAQQSRPATVSHVVDGDTLDAQLSDGSVVRVRLIGIDTPERIRMKVGEAEQYPVLKIKLGTTDDMAILNAQLQSLVSLYDYVNTSGDSLARADVVKMSSATRTLLPQLDTGCWSRYSLGGSPASLHYHTYHVSLLKQLAARTGDALWSTTAARWDGYVGSGGSTSC